MKSSSRKTSAKNPADEYNQLVDELQDMTQPTHSTKGEDEGCDITSLKSRAQQLMVWITLHKNHVDRHELADICKEGMKTIMKIMKATGKTDAAELDFELMVLEARKIACEEAFAEDLKRFDNITPDIIESLPPKVQLSIKTRISKAKSNIYTTTDTPDGILGEIGDMNDKVKDSSVDDIISQTLDTDSNFLILRRSLNVRQQLRDYIRERIVYAKFDALIRQVKSLLDNCNVTYDFHGFKLPRDLSGVINTYNAKLSELRNDHFAYIESYKYVGPIEIAHFDLESLSLDGSIYPFEFDNYKFAYEEMETLICDIRNRIHKLFTKIDPYVCGRTAKPSYIELNEWNHYVGKLREIYQEFINGTYKYTDDIYLSYYNRTVDYYISKLS